MDTYIGFDSAWMDKARGAICAVAVGQAARFHAPRSVTFDEALKFILGVHSEKGNTLIALDQPTTVPNSGGMRPVERVAASLISWIGGGVQPSNRGKLGMFCNASPIWRFITSLNATQDPERARVAADGLFLMEVFPALALPSLDATFFNRLGGPKYNPARKTFRPADWVRVAEAAAREARSMGCWDLEGWCRDAGKITKPRKEEQDLMDSALCALTALRWRLRPRNESMLLGDLTTGYMVLPCSSAVLKRLVAAAQKFSVAIDGVRPDVVPPNTGDRPRIIAFSLGGFG